MDLKLTKEEQRQEAGTPKHIFKVLHREYQFTVDACASRFNKKLARYWSKKKSGPFQNWDGERIFCNPPYSDIPPWLCCSIGYAATLDIGKPETFIVPRLAVYLLPVRSDRFWWKIHKPLAEVHYFLGQKPDRRLQFIPPRGFKYSTNPASNCLFCFGEGFTPRRERWRSGRTGELI